MDCLFLFLLLFFCFFCLFVFYGIATFVGYLTPNPFLYKKIVLFKLFSANLFTNISINIDAYKKIEIVSKILINTDKISKILAIVRPLEFSKVPTRPVNQDYYQHLPYTLSNDAYENLIVNWICLARTRSGIFFWLIFLLLSEDNPLWESEILFHMALFNVKIFTLVKKYPTLSVVFLSLARVMYAWFRLGWLGLFFNSIWNEHINALKIREERI